MQKEYKTIREIAGPLVFVEKTEPVGYGELVQIAMPDGSTSLDVSLMGLESR